MGLTEPRGFRDVQRWVWLFHISSLPQTCVLQQKHQSQALSAHMSSFDLEQMQKNSLSRWLSITQPAPMRPQLYTKVVFTQQIKRRLRLKTFFISTVIVVSKSFGLTSMFVHVRPPVWSCARVHICEDIHACLHTRSCVCLCHHRCKHP